jgi:hypothetical protein
MRRLLLCLLAAFACGSAFAAPVDYQFFAFVTTRHTGSSARLPAALTPDQTFIGTLTYDAAHRVNGGVSPVVALRLTTTDGTEIFNSASRPVFSSVMTRSQNSVESVLIGADIPLSLPDSLNVQFSWASPGQGQLPADPAAVDVLALRPYGWKFSLVNADDRVDAQIFTFRRADTQAEYAEKFAAAPSHWTNTGGAFTTQGGYYANAANVVFTSSVYTGQTLQPFVVVSADLYSGFTNSGNALGLLLNYRDAANFYEVRFTANGVVTINKVVNGARTMLQTGSYPVPPHTFFHVEVLRDFEDFEVRINNGPAITAEDNTLRDGQAGVFSSWNMARFDNFTIQQLNSWSNGGLLSDFSSFEPQAGTWVAENGVYRSTSNLLAAISVDTNPFYSSEFSLSARMRLQWANSGNRGGLVYDYDNPQNYSAVLVSPRTATRAGSVEVVQVVNGVRHMLARSTDSRLAAGQWGEVNVSYIDGVVRVAVTGMSAPYLTFAQQNVGPRYGFIASWNLVQFKDAVFRTQNINR